MIAIYHRVYRRENFEKAAQDLIGLLYAAQCKKPDQPRALYVDIDGHRNEAGGFDADMLELQMEFAVNVLLPYVKELHLPLISVENPNEQKNDVPEKLFIQNPKMRGIIAWKGCTLKITLIQNMFQRMTYMNIWNTCLCF